MITKFHLIAKMVFNILGIYSFIWCLNIFMNFTYFNNTLGSQDAFHVWIVKYATAVFIGFIVFIILKYFFLNDKWIIKIAGLPEEGEKPLSELSIFAGLQLSFIFCGIIIIVYNLNFIIDFLFFLVNGPKILIEMVIYKFIHEMFKMPFESYFHIVVTLFKTIFGLYLVLGAKKIVNWQAKKLKQSIDNINENPVPS